jgi:hypothetical protein
MKKTITLILFFLSWNVISSQTFEIVSTKLLLDYGEHSIRCGTDHVDFTQLGGYLTHDETINYYDSFVSQSTGETITNYASVGLNTTETINGMIVSNSSVTYATTNGQVIIWFYLLFEIKNNSSEAQTLYYGINPNMFFYIPAADENWYQFELYHSDKNGDVDIIQDQIYVNRFEAQNNTRIRGIAEASVAAGDTVYLAYAVRGNLITGSGIFMRSINAASSIAFSASPIPEANDLGFANLPANARMLFYISNLEGYNNSWIPMGDIPNTFAFQNLGWNSSISQGMALGENIDIIDGCSDITVEVENTDLFAFEQWDGNTGDSRTYINGTAYIKQSGTTVLTVNNVRFDLDVNYSIPYGNGGPLTASGWGEIDVEHSNADWVSAFDPYNTGQINFECLSLENPLEYYYDLYVRIVPSPIERVLEGQSIPENGAVAFSPNLHLSMNITLNKSGGTKGGAQKRVMGVAINGAPGGTNPEGIEYIYDTRYWELGTTEKNFTASPTFDLTGFSISNWDDLRLLKRMTTGLYGEIIVLTKIHKRLRQIT